MPFDPGVPPKWVRWLWEVDATEAAEEWEGGKGLGIGKIVRAGIALADDEGLEGVSVRKLAQRLSVSAMAAYRHISSRDEVIAAMVDVAFGPPPVLSGYSDDWAGGLRCWALAVQALNRHVLDVADVQVGVQGGLNSEGVVVLVCERQGHVQLSPGGDVQTRAERVRIEGRGLARVV